jgi:hypothetical protein
MGATALGIVLGAVGPPGLDCVEEPARPPVEQPERPPSETPIADSVDRVVAQFIRERLSPCATADGVPCFPVTVEVQGRQYSVRETLEHYELDSRPVPGTPPTPAEVSQYGANPRPTSGSVGFDPKAIVCKTRQLLRAVRGKSRTYYLYRLWDHTGERAVLRDRPLEPEELAASPHARYVPLGRFDDECEAVRAYLTATHDVRERREARKAEREETPRLELQPEDMPE